MAKLFHARSLVVLPLLLGTVALEIPPAIGLSSQSASTSPFTPSSRMHQFESSQLIAGWGTVFRRRTRRLTNRGGVCAIAPGLVGPIKVWSDRPLFVWQGTAKQVNIRSHATRELIWTETLNAPAQYVAYAGEALEIGKLYQWQVLSDNPSESDRNQWFTFEVMPSTERDPIAADLQVIETEMRGRTAEAIALRKAEYFIEKNLWSDALQVLYTVDNPSETVLQTQRSVHSQFCSPQSEDAVT